MKLSPVLFNELAPESKPEPALESRSTWLPWFVLGMLAGGSLNGIWNEYEHRLAAESHPAATVTDHTQAANR